MAILVTGSAGFIGSHLVEYLLGQKRSVIGIDNFNDFYDVSIKVKNCSKYFEAKAINELVSTIESPYRNFQAATDASIYQAFTQTQVKSIESGLYKLYGVDLCDYNNLRKIFEENNITHIVNLAALAGVRPSTQKPVLYVKNNGESCSNLLSLAKEFGIKKFVHASSSSVYGERSKVPFSETEDVSKPISPYAATKVADEARLHCFNYLYKMPIVALRFFTVYGPRQRPDLAIHKFTKLIDQGKEIEIYGDGSAKRDFTYVDDIMDGLTKAIDLDCQFEVFNLGESRTTDVNTLIALLEERLKKKAQVKYCPPIPGDVPITYADISKSKAILGYKPETHIEAGLDKFVEWYLSTKTLQV